MTRDELLARREKLIPIHQNPNYEHELQWLEVETELRWISAELKKFRR